MSFANLEAKTSTTQYTVTCKRCGRKNLRWIRNYDAHSGWALEEENKTLHDCYTHPKITEGDKLLAHFYNDIVIWENDSEEVKQKKMEYQRRLKDNPDEGELIDRKIIFEQYDEYYRSYTYHDK